MEESRSRGGEVVVDKGEIGRRARSMEHRERQPFDKLRTGWQLTASNRQHWKLGTRNFGISDCGLRIVALKARSPGDKGQRAADRKKSEVRRQKVKTRAQLASTTGY